MNSLQRKKKEYIQNFKQEIKENQKIKQIREQVMGLCEKFPLYPEFDVLK